MNDLNEFLNKHKDLLGRVSPDDLLKIVAGNDASVWAQRYRMIRGMPMRFVDYDNPHRHRPFLEMPLKTKARHKTARKSRQIGFSEIFQTEALWAADTFDGTKWMYTFPRNTNLETFSKTRLGPAIQESPYLRNKVRGGQDNVYLKQIGSSFIVLRSAWDPALGESVDADGVFFDEKDRMQSGVEVAFQESMSSSRFQWRRDISTPTIPGRGVDETFQLSTQYYWFVRCEACGHRQVLDKDSIIEVKPVAIGIDDFEDGSYEYRCKKCHEPRVNRWEGEWVAKHPGREIIGWSLSQLMCVWISADLVMRKRLRYKHDDLWVRYVLGLPFSVGGGLADRHHFIKCMTKPDYRSFLDKRIPDVRRVAVGIDWGYYNWVSVRGVSRNGNVYLLDLKVFQDTDEPLGQVNSICNYLKVWHPDIIVADAGYGKDRNAAMAKIYRDRFFACSYPRSEDTDTGIKPKWNAADRKVTVHRSTALRQTAYQYRNQEVTIPCGSPMHPQLSVFINHFGNCQVVRDEEDDGTLSERVENSGPDHYLHADTYARLGIESALKRNKTTISM